MTLFTILIARVARICLPAAWIVLAAAGCGEHESHGEVHAGHVLPAHKPRTFPAAVHHLRALHGQIGHDVAGGTADAKTLNVALDIANWLPELAADSDMPEEPWNRVDSHAGVLAADFRQMLSGNARGPLASVQDEITALERILKNSDPHWFRGIRKAESVTSQ